MPITNYYWDVDTDNVVLEEDENGNTIAEYTQEPSLYGELIAQERDGQASFYNFDGQGSTRELTDENQNVTDEYTYSAFGETVASSGTTENPFRYKGAFGYYTNSETGDVYVRERAYQPTVGRWISVDPIGFEDGTNVFVYLASNPVDLVDPSGLIRIKVEPGDRYTLGRCGSKKYRRWDFKLNADDRKKETCEGYIVQKVTVECERKDCATDCDNKLVCGDRASGGSFTYYEAWYVKQGKYQPHGQTKHTDEAWYTPPDDSCGFYQQKGEIRFFCISVTGDLGKKGQSGIWTADENRRFGEDTGCGTGAGGLPAIDGKDPPAFWKEGGDAPGRRSFQVTWECCDANKGKRKATTTFDP